MAARDSWVGLTVASIAALLAGGSCARRDPLALVTLPTPDATPAATTDSGTSADGGGQGNPDAGPPAAWTEMSPPRAPFGDATMTDAWAAGDDDLFVTAYLECPHGSAQCAGRVPLVLHWRRGLGWNSEGGPLAVGWTPRSIDGTSAEDVWAVGGDAIYHRDAGGWSLVDPSWQTAATSASDQPISLLSVRALAAGDVWAVSPKLILHRASGIWSATSIPTTAGDSTPGSTEQYLDRLWAFAPDEVWVSGHWVSVGSTMTPAFLCRAERAPLDCIAPTNGSRFGVAALFGAGGGRVWAAVPYYSDSQDVPIALERIDWIEGKTVTAASVDGWPTGQPLQLLSMWGRSADDVWAVGSGSTVDFGPVAHFDGRRWTMFAPPPAASEWCTLVAGAEHTVFVATSTGRIFRLDQTAGR